MNHKWKIIKPGLCKCERCDAISTRHYSETHKYYYWSYLINGRLQIKAGNCKAKQDKQQIKLL